MGAHSGYHQFVRYLDPARYDTTVHAASDSDADLAASLAPFRSWLTNGTNGGRMPWYKLSDLNAEAEALERCRGGEIDIIHFLDGEHSGQFLPRWIKSVGSVIRTIATFHQPPNLAAQLVNPALLRWLDAIVLVSPSQLPFFAKHASEDKIHVILHGVDAGFFSPSPELHGSERLRCITVGHWLRDWDVFKSVARILPDVDFLVVGRSAAELASLPNVTIQSGVADDALAKLYRSADLLFLPLIDATANNALLEGMACGLPVVTTDLETTRAYASEADGCLVPPGDVDGLVAAVRILQRDVRRRRAMGRRARQRGIDLDWRNAVVPYEELYAKLLSEPKRVTRERLALRDRLPAEREEDAEGGASRPAFLAPVADQRKLAGLDGWGHALLEANLRGEAAVLFRQLRVAAPDDYRGFAGSARVAEEEWNWAGATKLWESCLEIAPYENRVQAIVGKARCLAQTGSLGEATSLLSSIDETFEGLEGLAQIAALEGSGELALKRWERCVTQFPDRVEGFLGLATRLLKEDRFPEAEETIAHAVAVWPESAESRAAWALSATLAANWTAAGDRWKEVLPSLPGCPSHFARGYARYLAVVGERAEVDKYLERIAHRPIASAAFAGAYALAGGDTEAAIAQACRLVDLDGDKPRNWARVAILLMLQNEASTALSILLRISRRSPDSILVKVWLAAALIANGRNEEAASLLRSIPSEAGSAQVEIVRAWYEHHLAANAGAVAIWKAVFLEFGLLWRRTGPFSELALS
jgi:glycosyltransferase involved in cell wall biosynthesis/tetratricopeptide (TPR) repeat protein